MRNIAPAVIATILAASGLAGCAEKDVDPGSFGMCRVGAASSTPVKPAAPLTKAEEDYLKQLSKPVKLGGGAGGSPSSSISIDQLDPCAVKVFMAKLTAETLRRGDSAALGGVSKEQLNILTAEEKTILISDVVDMVYSTLVLQALVAPKSH